MSSTNRVSGMISGMDTESLVSAYVSSYRAKKEKYEKAQTKLSWTQDAWKSLNTKVYSGYTKISNYRFSKMYNTRKTTVSDATKATVTADSTAVNGTQTLKISQLAKSGYLTGAQLAKGTTDSTTLADLGYDDDETTISLKVGSGESKEITVSGSTKISEFIKSLQKAGVNASYDSTNRRIFVSAKTSGADNDFGITASSENGNSVLSALGLLTNSSADMSAYAANSVYAKGYDADGNIVNYYELDSDGNIKKDASGNAIINSAVVETTYTDADGNEVTSKYSPEATQAALADILTNLAKAHDENSSLESEKTTLNNKIKYSNAKDATTKVLDDLFAEIDANEELTDEEKASKKEDLTDKFNKLSEYILKQAEGAEYVDDDGNYYLLKNVSSTGVTYSGMDGTSSKYTTQKSLKEEINSLAKDLGLITTTEENGSTKTDKTAYTAFAKNVKTVNSYESKADFSSDSYYLDSDGITAAKERITAIDEQVSTNKAYITANKTWDQDSWADYYSETDGTQIDADKINALSSSITSKISYARSVTDGETEITANEGATRVAGQDSIIYLNEAKFTSNTNNFSINGLTINATATTGDDEITISTATDTQGIYDNIKEFLSTYNELINEMESLYNADNTSSYEPLTDDEKEAMSDTEIEKWEEKAKSGLLRRDTTLGTLINSMTSAMASGIEVNGSTYYLSSFGVQTLGYLNAAENEQYAYHIYGDEEDSSTSSYTDKLMAAIEADPDKVASFFSQLASKLYTAVGDKMKSTNLSSVYTVYNDKEMASEYSNYTTLIDEWEDKIEDMEDRYYSKFSTMETQLAKLQSSSSSISSLLGS